MLSFRKKKTSTAGTPEEKAFEIITNKIYTAVEQTEITNFNAAMDELKEITPLNKYYAVIAQKVAAVREEYAKAVLDATQNKQQMNQMLTSLDAIKANLDAAYNAELDILRKKLIA